MTPTWLTRLARERREPETPAARLAFCLRCLAVKPGWAARRRLSVRQWRQLGATCWVCRAPATCVHHLVPVGQGGTNAAANLVRLCAACHAAIHPWLAEPLATPRPPATAHFK